MRGGGRRRACRARATAVWSSSDRVEAASAVVMTGGCPAGASATAAWADVPPGTTATATSATPTSTRSSATTRRPRAYDPQAARGVPGAEGERGGCPRVRRGPGTSGSGEHPDGRGGLAPLRRVAAGVAAAGAEAASFPIHSARQPTPAPLPSAACSPSDSARWCWPPPIFRSGSSRAATPSIWSAGRCATRSSGRPRPAHPRVDLDFTTDARPDEIEAAGRADGRTRCGPRASGSAPSGCRRGGRTFEITTHRAEVYRPDSRKPEVAFGDSVEDDLSRRDFTVNAMALRLPELELIDPFGGLDDLSAHRLRTPLGPEVSFSDDPLRMLRAARFSPKLDLEPVPELVEAVRLGPRPALDRLGRADPRRARQDHGAAGALGRPCGSWSRTGLAEEFLPELPALALEQDPIHRHKDVLAHTLAVVDKTQPRPAPSPRRALPRRRASPRPGPSARRA